MHAANEWTVRIAFNRRNRGIAMGKNRDKSRAESGQTAGKVILVDDDSQVLNSLSILLCSYDFSVRAYDSPLEALAAFKEESADTVVTDIQMAEMNGITLLEKIREIDREATIILMTGHLEPEMTRAAVRMKAFEVILKPFDPEFLINAVRKGIACKRVRNLSNCNGADHGHERNIDD